ncbi:hypothetical protein L2Y90_27305 [Burkholderia pyrrocinia]|uniref:hypothetical protein n=1 Tax=Burkholderia pyrrocinia TaxID=60550 RepID=UPI00215A8664|nr:hypothetical protein [Burkholderia pyrrocinia]UVE67830.1 hypothetical protein L2Y90_27305 [Burkholderia pyrrocinia]
MSILPLLASINWSFKLSEKNRQIIDAPAEPLSEPDKTIMWNPDISGRDFFIH